MPDKMAVFTAVLSGFFGMVLGSISLRRAAFLVRREAPPRTSSFRVQEVDYESAFSFPRLHGGVHRVYADVRAAFHRPLSAGAA